MNPLKGPQIPVTSQITLITRPFNKKKKNILSKFMLKKYVDVPFNNIKSVHGYIDDEGIFVIIRSYHGFRLRI